MKIALIEAQGIVGGSEAALLEEARKRGAALGADAIVRQEVTAFYQPPVLVYDPAYANMFYPRYRYPYRSFYSPPTVRVCAVSVRRLPVDWRRRSANSEGSCHPLYG